MTLSFFFSSRRRHTSSKRDWSSDVCSSDLDLRGGRCVRLRQGDYEQETVFGSDPAAMARRWVAEGAEVLHIVDLDRSEERRVGKECRSRWAPDLSKKIAKRD